MILWTPILRSGSLPPLADVISILSGMGNASRYGQREAVLEAAEARLLGPNRRHIPVRLPFALPCQPERLPSVIRLLAVALRRPTELEEALACVAAELSTALPANMVTKTMITARGSTDLGTPSRRWTKWGGLDIMKETNAVLVFHWQCSSFASRSSPSRCQDVPQASNDSLFRKRHWKLEAAAWTIKQQTSSSETLDTSARSQYPRRI